jgi:hypothetical protein
VQAQGPVWRHGWLADELMVLPDHLLRGGTSEEIQVNQTTYHPAARLSEHSWLTGSTGQLGDASHKQLHPGGDISLMSGCQHVLSFLRCFTPMGSTAANDFLIAVSGSS